MVPTDYVHREYGGLDASSVPLSAISPAMSFRRVFCGAHGRDGAGVSALYEKGDAKAECEQLDQDELEYQECGQCGQALGD